MSTKYNIAVIGAIGSVGGQILSILEERNFPYDNVYALGAANSIGKKVSFGEDKTLKIDDFKGFDFSKTHIVFTCPGSDIPRSTIEKATSQGAIVIDSTALYRTEENIPLIVPEVNPNLVKNVGKNKIIANPNCCTFPIVTALSPLHNAAKIKRIVISTYQAVSDLGKDGMDELYNQTKSRYMQGGLVTKAFQKQIAFNIIPQIGELEKSGNSGEEQRIASEIQKILSDEIKVSVTCVRVPVFIGHTISINVEFYNKIDAKEACELLEDEDEITISHSKNDTILSPVDVVGYDLIYISRLRDDISSPNSINLIISTDNLRKGAALNAVQIAEKLIHCL